MKGEHFFTRTTPFKPPCWITPESSYELWCFLTHLYQYRRNNIKANILFAIIKYSHKQICNPNFFRKYEILLADLDFLLEVQLIRCYFSIDMLKHIVYLDTL